MGGGVGVGVGPGTKAGLAYGEGVGAGPVGWTEGVELETAASGDGATGHFDPARWIPTLHPAGVVTRTMVPAVPRVIRVTKTTAGHGE